MCTISVSRSASKWKVSDYGAGRYGTVHYCIKKDLWEWELTCTILLAERARGDWPANGNADGVPSDVVTKVTASSADFLGGVGLVRGLDTSRLTAATAGVREVGGGLLAAVSLPGPCNTVWPHSRLPANWKKRCVCLEVGHFGAGTIMQCCGPGSVRSWLTQNLKVNF